MGATEDAALLVAACRSLGQSPVEVEEVVVTIRCQIGGRTVRHQVQGRPGPGAGDDGPIVLHQLPVEWQKLLTLLAGAAEDLTAVEAERRLRADFEGDRATPAVSLRLQDMDQAGLLVHSRKGYRRADRPP